MLKDKLTLYNVERTRTSGRSQSATETLYKSIWAEPEAVAEDDLYAASISIKKEVIKYVVAYKLLKEIPRTVTKVIRRFNGTDEEWTLERFVRDKPTRNAIYLTRTAR